MNLFPRSTLHFQLSCSPAAIFHLCTTDNNIHFSIISHWLYMCDLQVWSPTVSLSSLTVAIFLSSDSILSYYCLGFSPGFLFTPSLVLLQQLPELTPFLLPQHLSHYTHFFFFLITIFLYSPFHSSLTKSFIFHDLQFYNINIRL